MNSLRRGPASGNGSSMGELEKTIERDQRFVRILELRSTGLSFTKIGKEIGVGAQRARELFQRAQRKQERPIPSGLTNRTVNALMSRYGRLPSPQELSVISWADLLRTKNLGKHGAAIVVRYVESHVGPDAVIMTKKQSAPLCVCAVCGTSHRVKQKHG